MIFIKVFIRNRFYIYFLYSQEKESQKKIYFRHIWEVRKSLYLEALALDGEPVCVPEQGLKNSRGIKWGGA